MEKNFQFIAQNFDDLFFFLSIDFPPILKLSGKLSLMTFLW